MALSLFPAGVEPRSHLTTTITRTVDYTADPGARGPPQTLLWRISQFLPKFNYFVCADLDSYSTRNPGGTGWGLYSRRAPEAIPTKAASRSRSVRGRC